MNKHIIYLLILAITVLFIGQESFAGIFSDNLNEGPGKDVTVQFLRNLLGKVACWLLEFAIMAIGIMMVVYGIMFLKSRGNPGEMTNAKRAFSWGLIGGLVIFGVFTIIYTVAGLTGADYDFLRNFTCN